MLKLRGFRPRHAEEISAQPFAKDTKLRDASQGPPSTP